MRFANLPGATNRSASNQLRGVGALVPDAMLSENKAGVPYAGSHQVSPPARRLPIVAKSGGVPLSSGAAIGGLCATNELSRDQTGFARLAQDENRLRGYLTGGSILNFCCPRQHPMRFKRFCRDRSHTVSFRQKVRDEAGFGVVGSVYRSSSARRPLERRRSQRTGRSRIPESIWGGR
jgi:hypothetical protein